MNKICQRLAACSANRCAKSLRCSGVVVARSVGYCDPSTPDAVRISRTQANGTTCKKFSCAAFKVVAMCFDDRWCCDESCVKEHESVEFMGDDFVHAIIEKMLEYSDCQYMC